MLTYPNIDPIALSLGPLNIHWYGLMYLIGFAGAWYLAMYRVKTTSTAIKQQHISDLIFYSAMGVVLGGRAGYVLFYNFDYFLQDPLWLLAIWQGGMSFHGGLLGVILALYLYAKKLDIGFFVMTDFVAPLVPIGLGAGRIGNFIGGELWGRVTTVPWGMVFPGAGELPRHPSQLYQFGLEGITLFAILWVFSSKHRPTMAVSGIFLCFYGLFRFIVEFFRQPDAHIGFLSMGWLTMGQLLSMPMVLMGVLLLVAGYSSVKKAA